MTIVVHFGKYKGQALSSIPDAALRRYAEARVNDRWRRIFLFELQRRREVIVPAEARPDLRLVVDGWRRKLLFANHPDRGGDEKVFKILDRAAVDLLELLERERLL